MCDQGPASGGPARKASGRSDESMTTRRCCILRDLFFTDATYWTRYHASAPRKSKEKRRNIDGFLPDAKPGTLSSSTNNDCVLQRPRANLPLLDLHPTVVYYTTRPSADTCAPIFPLRCDQVACVLSPYKSNGSSKTPPFPTINRATFSASAGRTSSQPHFPQLITPVHEPGGTPWCLVCMKRRDAESMGWVPLPSLTAQAKYLR